MKMHSLWVLGLLGWVTWASAQASTVDPVSYDMHNGDGQANGGSFNYWDLGYSGSGSTNVDNAWLSGGLGDLTDGVTTNQDWTAVENSSGTGPYVGWLQSATPTVSIVFNFAGLVDIDTIRIHADGESGGGVAMPSSATFTWASGTSTTAIVNSYGPSWLDFTGLDINGASSVTVTLAYGNQWIFVDEVQFIGAPVPEPASAILMLLGLAGLGAAARRRR